MKTLAGAMLTAFWLCCGALLGGCAPEAAPAGGTRPTVRVQLEAASVQPMSQSREVYGTLDYATDAMRSIDATAEVEVIAVLVVAGQQVAAGQALMQLRSTALAGGSWQHARNDQLAAAAELQRVKRLLAQHLATRSELNLAQQAAANARADWAAASARIGAPGDKIITAEHAASIVSVDVARGDIVAADAALLRLANSGALSARLGIEPADLALLKLGQAVRLQAAFDRQQQVTGRVVQVLAQIDAQTRLASALVELDDPVALPAGAAVFGNLELQLRPAVLGVPRAAVLEDGTQAYLFVAEDGIAHRVDIVAGQSDATRVEILEGLREGAQVVVLGNHEIEDGMPIHQDGKAASQ